VAPPIVVEPQLVQKDEELVKIEEKERLEEEFKNQEKLVAKLLEENPQYPFKNKIADFQSPVSDHS